MSAFNVFDSIFAPCHDVAIPERNRKMAGIAYKNPCLNP
jgi:hypothetical protein